jgi:hypothetical protein
MPSLTRTLALLFVLACATSLWADDEVAFDDLPNVRLDQLQIIGTHNSYHIAPDEFAKAMIRAGAPAEADANDYSHPPLTEQLDRLGLRVFELDLYLDPGGDLFHKPLAYLLGKPQAKLVPPFDPDRELARPGIKILHSPDFDFRTTTYSLHAALTELKAWSDKHRRHVPIFVLLELKSESFSPLTKPLAWDAAALETLEKELLAVLPRERILTPDDIRGEQATLRAAILASGWPSVDDARGKFVFLLDNEDRVRAEYLKPSATLAKRLLFASVSRDHAAAAFMKRNDPVGSFAEIQALVGDKFLVRTRADSGTVEARSNLTKRREQAIASGAQLISTDFPVADERFSDYRVRFEHDRALRVRPDRD